MEGHAHPITLAIARISEIFSTMGFSTVDGPELEDEWHNFDALNVPKDHPARDMQDTFWIKKSGFEDIHNQQTKDQGVDPIDRTGTDKYGDPVGHVLRTHTSNMQIRTMEQYVKEGTSFPLAICCPGKVFRNEATDATHEAQFHQIEMLYVGKDASLAMMLGVIETFFSEFFGGALVVRLRSSYFPFVEPGNEVDMQCFKCTGAGCSLCKQTGWIEICGAGMVHPRVLEAGGINPREYRGFAFGCGIDRMLMLKYGIDDVRLLYNGDLRVVSQF
jgi:phenylalanyl-tRNA synthetase alpha chain